MCTKMGNRQMSLIQTLILTLCIQKTETLRAPCALTHTEEQRHRLFCIMNTGGLILKVADLFSIKNTTLQPQTCVLRQKRT
jgi:hypothetical protein